MTPGHGFDERLARATPAEKKQGAEVEALRATVHGLVGMESDRKAQREELSALKATMQDVSNKLSILLDRDAQRQRRDDAVDGHLRDLDRRMGALEAQAAASAATLQQLREGGGK